MKIKHTLFTLLLLLPNLVLADNFIRFESEGIDIRSQAPNVEFNFINHGDGTSEGSAPEVYVPILAGANANYRTKGATFPIDTTTATSLIRVFIDITNDDGTAYDLFLAAKKSGSDEYLVIKNFGNATTTPFNIDFDLKTICDKDADLDFDCTNLDAGTDDKEEIEIYIGIGIDADVQVDDEIDIGTAPFSDAGIIMNLLLNNKVTTTGTLLTSLKKGDGQLFAIYDGAGMDSVYKTYARTVNLGSGFTDITCELTVDTSKDFASLPAGTDTDLDSTADVSDARIKNLENGSCHTAYVYFVDEWFFASQSSNGKSAIPEDIQALLEKQACFLFTAGFGGGHPVVDFFRNFRDEFLLDYSWGRWLNEIYYRTAPQYAITIYKTPWMARAIRLGAYTLYGVMRFWYVFAAIGVVLGFLGLYNRKRQNLLTA